MSTKRKKKKGVKASEKGHPGGHKAGRRPASEKPRLERLSRRTYLGLAGLCLFLVAGFVYFSTRQIELPARQVWAQEYTIPPKNLPLGEVESALRKVPADADEWVSEEQVAEIEKLLDEFATALKRAGGSDSTLHELLSSEFKGTPLEPNVSRKVKTEKGLEIFRGEPTRKELVTPETFPSAVRKLLREAEQIDYVKFKVTRIESPPIAGPTADPILDSDVIYYILGQGSAGESLQWKGNWRLSWHKDDGDGWKLVRLQALSTSRGRSARKSFVEITQQALGKNNSYHQQLLRGVDHWQGVLDVVSGMDIYGHNGVSIADVDGDGDEDFYVSQPAGLPNLLFQNNGDGTFLDITREAGVDVLDNTSSGLFADIDNDRDPDLILIGPKSMLFHNEGSGRFSLGHDSGFEAIDRTKGSKVSAAVADYDRDGYLDLYICSYAFWRGQEELGNYPLPYYDANNGAPNILLRNNGNGKFRDVTTQSGMNQNNLRFSFAAAWGDYNGDHFPDLYVANDFGRNNLYRNNGDGTFTDVAREAGVEDIGAGMSAAWEDFDNDGHLDLYVGNMWSSAGQRITSLQEFQNRRPEDAVRWSQRHAKGNSLFRNKGDGTFEEISAQADAELGRWAWSSDFFDFDNDGHEDLYVLNGFITNEDTKDL